MASYWRRRTAKVVRHVAVPLRILGNTSHKVCGEDLASSLAGQNISISSSASVIRDQPAGVEDPCFSELTGSASRDAPRPNSYIGRAWRPTLFLLVYFCSCCIPDIAASVAARTRREEVERRAVFRKPRRTIIRLAIYRIS